MNKFLTSLLIGIIAGIIDVVPMIIQKLDRYADISAFVHWIALGIIIAYIQMPVSSWLKGIIIAEITALPVIVLVLKDDPKGVIPILIMSTILGALVGIATEKFAGQ